MEEIANMTNTRNKQIGEIRQELIVLSNNKYENKDMIRENKVTTIIQV